MLLLIAKIITFAINNQKTNSNPSAIPDRKALGDNMIIDSV
jgi:hypothetical protein